MNRIEKIKASIKKNKIAYKLLSSFKIGINKLIYNPIIKIRNKNMFLKYYKNSTNDVIIEATKFFRTSGVTMMPFKFTLKYQEQVKVNKDHSSGYPYVIIGGRNVFFPKMSNKKIASAVRNALMEQDKESPHKYIQKINDLQGNTAILIGSSDGIFALEIIDSFERIFLFECDPDWIAPVTLTLSPYKNKCVIVNKFVSNINTSNHITLDTFFKNYNFPISFMQHDVEGNSLSILEGAKNMLTYNNINLSIACYHTEDEAHKINTFLTEIGYKCSFSEKFMFLWMQKLKEPYLREGVLYANK